MKHTCGKYVDDFNENCILHALDKPQNAFIMYECTQI